MKWYHVAIMLGLGGVVLYFLMKKKKDAPGTELGQAFKEGAEEGAGGNFETRISGPSAPNPGVPGDPAVNPYLPNPNGAPEGSGAGKLMSDYYNPGEGGGYGAMPFPEPFEPHQPIGEPMQAFIGATAPREVKLDLVQPPAFPTQDYIATPTADHVPIVVKAPILQLHADASPLIGVSTFRDPSLALKTMIGK